MEKPHNSLPNPQGTAQQQNISINISYNLNTHKIPKSILGTKKSTSKHKKVHTPIHAIGNQFFSNMGFNSLNQGKKIVKKQNLSKKSNQSSLPPKQSKLNNDKKSIIKKKKSKQINITQPSMPMTDTIIEYYNPLANNAKHFLKRNIQSPDIFKLQPQRKLKTQASNYQPNQSTFKKIKKTTLNTKQSQSGVFVKSTKINNFVKDTGFNFIGSKVPVSINTGLKKPVISSKTPKNRKSSHQIKQKHKRLNTQQNQFQLHNQVPQARHNKSCMLYSTKKQGIITQPNLIEQAQHIMSTYVSVNSNNLPRKRAQSAYSFSRNGKQLVSKLLNMSIISSQLGSSQLISSERMKSGRNNLTRKRLGLKVDQFDQYNHYQKYCEQNEQKRQQRKQQQVLPGNALRQYLNSIDLRIIKNIEDDTANIAGDKSQKLQKINLKTKQIQKDDKKVFNNFNKKQKIFTQDKSEIEQNKTDVVSFYNKLFSNALQNRRIQDEQQKYIDSANQSQQKKSSSIDFEKTSKLKKQKFIINGFDDQQQQKQQEQENSTIKNGQKQQVYQFIKSDKPQGSRKLNFQHYKDLLNKQAEKQKKQQQTSKFNFSLINCQNQFQFVPYKDKQSKSQSLNNSSKQLIQEIDQQEKAIIDLIDKSFKSSQSPSSSLSHFKEQQIERWNNLNKILGKNIGSNTNQQTTKNQIIDELMKQSLLNKKWVDENHNELMQEESELISPQKSEIKEQKVILKEPMKSPKHSNRQKFSIQAEHNEVCWQYNAQQLDAQLENYNKQPKNITKSQDKNVYNNSPNNFSQDGQGSGQQEYDSKKYSQVSVYKDKVIENNKSQQFQHQQINKKELIHNGDSLIDSLNEDEQEQDGSFEQKEINSDNRWINNNFKQQSTLQDQGRIRKFKQFNQNQLNQKIHEDNYLQCDLADFGVKQQLYKTQQANYQKQHQQLQQQPVQSSQFKLSEAISIINGQKSQLLESHFKLTINGKQTNQKITLQVNQKSDTFSKIRNKRLTHIVQDIILQMIRQFARDISNILKKSSYQKKTQQQFEQNSSPFRAYKQHGQQHQLSPFSKQVQSIQNINNQHNKKQQQLKKSQFVGRCFGIDTSFLSVQKYLKEFKEYLLKNQTVVASIIKNINKDIGPNSLQILSYLRPEYQNIDGSSTNDMQGSSDRIGLEEHCQDQDGLFVVPSQAFSQFQNYLQQKIDQQNKNLQPDKQIILTLKQKRNTNFWHRGIYQSWNQFLDYERPYGINGKPYEWVKQRKKFRQVQIDEIEKKLQKGADKLLEAISLPSGIIYDKYDLPIMYTDLSEQQKIYLNEQRLSRMLAIQLFEIEQTWINYNDEMAQLLVELSRIIEDRIFFQMTTQLKKVLRKRNLLIDCKMGDELQQVNDKQQQNVKQRSDQQWLIQGFTE